MADNKKNENTAPEAQSQQAAAPEAQVKEQNKKANEKKKFSTMLMRVNDMLMPSLEKQLTEYGIEMAPYQRQCVLMGIAAINATIDKEGLNWYSPNFDSRNISEILQTIAMLQLNAAAVPREIYFQTRNVRTKDKENKKDIWMKQIEMGIEGDGNDAILRRFGAGVKVVGRPWLVREDDDFKYPQHKGFETTPPEWIEKGKGKVVRVVYPILKEDDTVEFAISEREDVMKNFAAHVANSMMNETFGIAKNRFDASKEQLEKISAKKKELLSNLDGLTIDQAIDCPDLQDWISPSWRERHSRESMIIRKMRNNAVKPIPKDFSSAYAATAYMRATDDIPTAIEAEIGGSANSESIDVEYQDVNTDPDTGEIIEPTVDPESDEQPEAPAPAIEPDGQVSLEGAASRDETAGKPEKPESDNPY